MPIGSGLAGQFGWAREGSWGVVQAPDHFIKASKAEIVPVNNVVQGGGFDTQMAEDGAEYALISKAGTGHVESIIRAGMVTGTQSPFGTMFQDIFGSAPTPAQQSASIAYLSTYTMGDSGARSSTLQAVMPNRAGTLYPFTLLGAKVLSATLSCQEGDYLRLSVDYDGSQVVESQAAATASYVSSAPFHFGDMGFKLGTFGAEATVQGVKGFSLTVTRPNDTDDAYYANNAVSNVSVKAEQLVNDRLTVTGTVDIDLSTKADFWDRGRDNTSTSMIIPFIKGTAIVSTFFPTLQLACPMTFFGAVASSLDDNGVVNASVPFTAKFDSVNSRNLMTTTYMSTGSAA